MSDHLTIDTVRKNKEQIKELVEFFSKAVEEKTCKEEIVNIFHKISFYIHDFFVNEELFMKKYEMPGFALHVQEHRDFTQKFMHFQNEFEKGNPNVCPNLLKFLKEWYEDHILNADEDIIEFVEKKNKTS